MAGAGERTMIAWWRLRPWRECGLLRRDIKRHLHRIDELDLAGIRLTDRNAELSRQLRVVSGAGSESGRALIGWEQQGGVKPELCLLGVDRGTAGGRRLYASRDLGGPSFGMTGEDDPPPRWHLATAMEKMLVIDKPTYGEAIAWLFEIWRPDSERPAVEGKRALTQP